MIDLIHAEKLYWAQANACSARTDRNGTPTLMKMTFEEWLKVWQDSGKWHLRGQGRGKYCMGRHDDLGYYEVGNVSIISQTENVKISCKRHNFGQMARGKKWFTDGVKTIYAYTHPGKGWVPGRTVKKQGPRPKKVKVGSKMQCYVHSKPAPVFTCPHCGKVGKGASPMKTWHFDNCRAKLQESPKSPAGVETL